MTGYTRIRTLAVAISVALLAGGCGGTATTDVVGPGDVRCGISVAPSEVPASASREQGSITVRAERECSWSAVSDAAWIAITSGSRGQGDGRIDYVVDDNPTASVRHGFVVVGEHQVEIVQEGAPCTFTLSASGATIGATGGDIAVSVGTLQGCAWTSTSRESWIVVRDGGAGDQAGTVMLQVAPNDGAPRTGMVTIAEQPYTIAQDGACSFTLSRTTSHVPAAGGFPAVDVLTQPWCEWSATSQVPWIGIAGSHGGAGSGTVTLAVEANGGPSRSGGVTIGGHLHTVTQEAAPCTYSLSPMSQRVPFSGGAFAVVVTTQPWCEWSAASHDSWIRITAGAQGVGSGTVTYDVSARSFPLPRTGTLTIAGEAFAVTQTLVVSRGPRLDFQLPPSNAQLPTVTAGAGRSVLGVDRRQGLTAPVPAARPRRVWRSG